MLFNLGMPGQSSPTNSFMGESDDKNWDIELKDIFFQHIDSSENSFIDGPVQHVIAHKRHSASHQRTLIGLGDIATSGFNMFSMPLTKSNGSPGISLQRIIVPLPPLSEDPKHSTYLHLVNPNLHNFIRQEKTGSLPVLSAFLVDQRPVPRDPTNQLVTELRSMLGFATGSSSHFLCVYHIDDVELPYHIEFMRVPSSVYQPSFAALPLLDLPQNNYIGGFVSKSYSHWKRASDIGFDLAMHFVLDSTNNPFLEIRFATLSVAFESLASHHATATGFSRELKDIKKGKYKSFKVLLNDICNKVGVAWDSKEFVDIRNKILHEGGLLPNATFDKYREFVNIFHQIILKTVKYSGTYTDVKTFSNGTI